MGVRFSASGQHYEAALGLGSQPSMSVTCWVKLDVDRNDYVGVWSIDAGSGGGYVTLKCDADGTTARILVHAQTVATRALTAGTWYFIGASWSATGGTLTTRAANQDTFTTVTWTTPAVVDAQNLRIGTDPAGSAWLNGSVAAVKVWTTALSTAALQAESYLPSPRQVESLTAWYPFLAAEAEDRSGNGHTLTGGTGTTTVAGPPYGSASQASPGTATGAYACPKPAGAEAGWALVAFQSADTGAQTDMATPTGGWTLIGDRLRDSNGTAGTKVWWKTAGESEPASYTFHQGSNADGCVSIVGVPGAVTALRPLITSFGGTTATTAVRTPSTTPAGVDDMEIRCAVGYSLPSATLTWTPPGVSTERTDIRSRQYVSNTTATRQLTSGADTGNRNFTASGSLSDYHGFTVTVELLPVTFGPQRRQNTFEGGTDSALITPANSGGGSGDAFYAVGGIARYVSGDAADGVMACRLENAEVEPSWVGFKPAGFGESLWMRAYLKAQDLPLPDGTELQLQTSLAPADLSTWSDVLLQVQQDGITIVHSTDAGETSLGKMMVAPAVGEWIRIEAQLTRAASGPFEVRLYNSAHSLSPSGTITGTITQTAAPWGLAAIARDAGVLLVDEFALSDAGWIGPAGEHANVGAANQVTTSEIAHPLRGAKTAPLRPVTGSGTAAPVGRTKSRAVTLAVDQGLVWRIKGAKRRLLAAAGESAAATTAGPAHGNVLGPAGEAASALEVLALAGTSIRQIGEQSLPIPLGRRKVRLLAPASETGAPAAVRPGHARVLAPTTEQTLVAPPARTKIRLVMGSRSSEVAQRISSSQVRATRETSQALALTPLLWRSRRLRIAGGVISRWRAGTPRLSHRSAGPAR